MTAFTRHRTAHGSAQEFLTMANSREETVRISIRDVTPEEAASWLGDAQLPWAAVKYVRSYAREMSERRWALNGETIIISRAGTLLDGRKRLRACVESGTPFPCVVVEGIDETESRSIDALRPRSAGDVLYIRHEKHHRVLASVLSVVVRYYRRYHNPVPSEKRLISRDALFALDIRPEIRESVGKTLPFHKLGTHTVTAAVHHLASRIDSRQADAFFDRVLHGPDAPDDPAYLLRTAFESSKHAGQELMLALTIRAWNAYYASRPLKYLRWRTEGTAPQKFPLVTALPPDDGADLEGECAPNPQVRVDARDLRIGIESITPLAAEQLFNGRAQNRNVVSRVVEKYARDMQAGQWGLNGQTIKISKTGRLLDGQHRCAAAVKTGTTFQAIVVRGLPDEVFDTLDAGASRSLGQVLAERGEKSSFALAASLQKLWLYEQDMPTLHTMRGSHTELLQVLERNPDIRRSVQLCVTKGHDIVPGAAGATTHYLAARTDLEKADAFVIGLGNGANLPAESPVLVLRELLIKNRSNKRKQLSEVEKWAVTIKAMNAFFEGRTMRLLIWRHGSNEPFPRVLERRNSAGRKAPRANGGDAARDSMSTEGGNGLTQLPVPDIRVVRPKPELATSGLAS
jgi:hypothetical protein